MSQLSEFIANHLFLVCLFVALLSLLLWDIFHGVSQGAKALSPAALTEMINREKPVLIDLRPKPDFSAGHIISAISIPASEFPASMDRLKAHKESAVVLYCDNGAQCSRHSKLLRQGGFQKLYTLRGGLIEWRHAHLPLQRK